MTELLMADLAHLFFLEQQQAKTDREARRLSRISHWWAVKCAKEAKRGK